MAALVLPPVHVSAGSTFLQLSKLSLAAGQLVPVPDTIVRSWQQYCLDRKAATAREVQVQSRDWGGRAEAHG